MEEFELLRILNESEDMGSLCESVGFTSSPNSRTRDKVKSWYNDIGIDLKDHFKNKSYIKKLCPVCGIEFIKQKCRESTTCSSSCANTHFRTGENHGNWKESAYRTTCFLYHKKECVVCGECNIVEVHHYDENHENNKPENLVPLCPTHHQYWHSTYKELVESTISKYVEDFKSIN